HDGLRRNSFLRGFLPINHICKQGGHLTPWACTRAVVGELPHPELVRGLQGYLLACSMGRSAVRHCCGAFETTGSFCSSWEPLLLFQKQRSNTANGHWRTATNPPPAKASKAKK